jgi:hypothetical protein
MKVLGAKVGNVIVGVSEADAKDISVDGLEG